MKQFKFVFSTIALLALFSLNSAFTSKTVTTKEWTATNADIRFSIKNAGFSTKGTLSGLSARIAFNPSALQGSIVDAYVLSNTINTENGMRDNHLRKPEYFDVAKFDKISLKATSFTKESDGSFKGAFKLTIKGVTKDVTIPFTFVENGDKATIKGSFSINRLDYGVGGTSMTLSNDLTISLNVGLSLKK